MAANIVVLRDEREWLIVSRVLSELEQGGIIVSPDTIERLDENFPGWEDEIDQPIEYDFGGEPDIAIDIARNGNHADQALDDYLIPIQHALAAEDQRRDEKRGLYPEHEDPAN